MEIIDANIGLRYLLRDNEKLSQKAAKILESKSIHIPFEVCAEVVYVLEKVYSIPRENIQNALFILLDYPNLYTMDKTILTV